MLKAHARSTVHVDVLNYPRPSVLFQIIPSVFSGDSNTIPSGIQILAHLLRRKYGTYRHVHTYATIIIVR